MGGRIMRPNLGDSRLRSVDQSNKAFLLLTRLHRTSKSYARDLTPRIVKLQYAG